MKSLVKIVLVGLSVFLAANYINGIEVQSLGTAMVMSLVLAVLNLVIRPILKFFTIPIRILTLGLFTLVINTFLFWLAGTLVDGIEIDGFIPAFLGSLLVTIISWLLEVILDRK
ncbi:hypothetical protein DL897_09400 [Thermoflavimicrobium daqui]|uniref:Phage holin family protein n=1 Tax=Thermoflavimicrobium daqui TaxID=2137476 RepID=A0A364K5L4_9BACL|nr:hypothetical protein DL897_09400 [Thermoflavimicrobium daqui]